MSRATIKDLSTEQLEYFLSIDKVHYYSGVTLPIRSKITTGFFDPSSIVYTQSSYQTLDLTFDNKTIKEVKEELFNRKVKDVLNES